MAEVLGIVASVIAVTHVATESLKHVATFFRAHKEFKALQASNPEYILTQQWPPVTLRHSLIAVANALFIQETMLTLSPLQEQLEEFIDILGEIRKEHSDSCSIGVTTSLSNAKRDIEQLDQLIKKHILPNAATSRARRAAWMRHKSKIYRLQHALKEHRQNLIVVVSAKSL